ncbi:MAG: CvpA family protein [Bacteroidales bacterium]|nr:CvpA family protein [Bacteroidales bacterium]
MEQFNYVDIVILLTVGVGMVAGLKEGIIKEAAGIASLVLGLLAARIFGAELHPFVVQFFNTDDKWTLLVSYFLIFLAVVIAIRLIAHIITKMLELVALGFINKILGAILGGVKYIIFFSLIFNIVELAETKFPIPGEESRKNSVLYEPICDVANQILPLIKEFNLPKIDFNQANKKNIISI